VLGEFLDAAGTLADMPGMGHSRVDLTDEPVLFWPVYGYLVVYRPESRPLEVVRVVHGSRDPKAIHVGLRSTARAE
jgi:antitoxin ParD1/3/4/toxin ParE1/3/4